MNANEISNADLDAILSGNVPTVGEVIALARAELDRRKAGEQKGVGFPDYEEAFSLLDYAWTIFCNAGDGDWSKESADWVKAARNFEKQWRKLKYPEAAKATPKPAVRWAMAGNTKAIARIEGHDIVERVWPCGVKVNGIVPFGVNEPWTMPGDIDLTEERYNQLKAEYLKEESKPVPVASFCHDCGQVHEGGCVNTSEAKEHAPTLAEIEPLPDFIWPDPGSACIEIRLKVNEIIATMNRLAKEGK